MRYIHADGEKFASRAIDEEIERQANEAADIIEDRVSDIDRIMLNFDKFGL